MNKVAIGRVVLTNREHIIALEPLEKGLMGTLLRYPYEVRSEEEYFDEIQDVKVTKDMLDLAKHIVNQKTGRFEPEKFEDQYETALIDLINQKRAGKPITPKERPRGENVVDLMEALRKSVGGAAAAPQVPKKSAKKSKKASAGQKEMLMPIAGKKQANETTAKKPAARSRRKSAGGHSGQVSPIESSKSAITTAAACREIPGGGSWRATLIARSRACGSARSRIQPCSSHSRMAPASSKTPMAHPSKDRIAGRGFFVTNILAS